MKQRRKLLSLCAVTMFSFFLLVFGNALSANAATITVHPTGYTVGSPNGTAYTPGQLYGPGSVIYANFSPGVTGPYTIYIKILGTSSDSFEVIYDYSDGTHVQQGALSPNGSIYQNWYVNTTKTMTSVHFVSNGATHSYGIQDVYVTVTAPSAPTGLSASNVTPNSLTLSWNTVTGANSYDVYKNGTILASGITGTSYNVTGLTPGTSYTFTVSAVNIYGEGPQSSPLNINTTNPPPSQPTGLKAVSVTTTSVSLSWSAVSGANSYKVYMDGSSVQSGITGTSCTVTGLSPGTNHTFTVSATNSGGESPQSAGVTVLTLPPAPTGITASNITTNSAHLTWNAVSGAISYTLYNTFTGVPIATGLTSTSYDWTGLSPGINYTVAVSATNATGEGPQSAVITVTTVAVVTTPSPTNVKQSGTPGGGGSITWTPGTGTPTGTVYTVYRDGQALGTTTGTSYTDPNYSPFAIYSVQALAPNTANTIYVASPQVNATGGQAPLSGSGLNWGFGPQDLLTNSVALVASIGSILLLILTFMFGPKLVRFIKRVIGRDKGPQFDSETVYSPIEYDYPTHLIEPSYNANVTTYATTEAYTDTVLSDTTTGRTKVIEADSITSDVSTRTTTDTTTKTTTNLRNYSYDF